MTDHTPTPDTARLTPEVLDLIEDPGTSALYRHELIGRYLPALIAAARESTPAPTEVRASTAVRALAAGVMDDRDCDTHPGDQPTHGSECCLPCAVVALARTAPASEVAATNAEAVRYVAGFLFSGSGEQVVLVRKNRPEWQAGRLNGVGGHIEAGESPAEAMRREFWEETGVDVDAWEQFATVGGPWGEVVFFRAQGDITTVRTMTDEEIEVHMTEQVVRGPVIPNLTWLIPLARYTHDTYVPVTVTEQA